MDSQDANLTVIEKDVGDAFHVCDKCGYKRGFHVSFVKPDGSYEIVLICPECGQQYKVKWEAAL